MEQRIEYLSTQVERLIELHHPFPSPMTPFRKTAMLAGLTFEEEALARKLLGAVHAHNSGEKVDITGGLLPVPAKTAALFSEYATSGPITRDEAKNLLNTVVPGGDAAAEGLLEAWDSAQRGMQRHAD
ncbi:hypothetical protein JKI95_03625 [Corynebacterium aquatimens]|uniref:hypothetical protein n=1 Tax=Corynebacterium aquatimens TaxID=1190508 RepID=UPI0025412962|nr:hypothetical protein [Corynebacterium aquatimens]QYH20103.1 hypothetical protein JKI95_03625 [Corynebacterium aquatimens]